MKRPLRTKKSTKQPLADPIDSILEIQIKKSAESMKPIAILKEK
jgi:hypothetical protein